MTTKTRHTEPLGTRGEPTPLAMTMPPVPGSSVPLVTADRVRARAFELFEVRQRKGIGGDAVADWLQAERELRSTPAGASPRTDLRGFPRGEALMRDDD